MDVKGNIKNVNELMNFFAFNSRFRPYTNPFRSYDYGIGNGDTSKKNEERNCSSVDQEEYGKEKEDIT